MYIQIKIYVVQRLHCGFQIKQTIPTFTQQIVLFKLGIQLLQERYLIQFGTKFSSYKLHFNDGSSKKVCRALLPFHF